MRDTLTILAIALIVVLTAALVGPYLVDWSAERGWIEARLTQTLGARAEIHGAIDLKLLPSPYFVVDDIEIGEKPAPFTLSAKKLRLELAPAALLRGEIDIVEARLEAPRLALDLAPDGALPLAPPETSVAGRFRFERITVANGALSVVDAKNNRRLDLEGIDFEAAAESLFGPFKGGGALGRADSRTPFRFATGPMEKGELNLKLFIEAALSHPGVDLDGLVDLRPGAQRFTGAAKFKSAAEPLWRASGQLTLDTESAAFDQIELRVGEDAHELSAKGEAALDYSGAPKASATLASDAIDLDAWRGADPAGGAGFGFILPPAFPPLPLTLTYGAKTVTFGGATFTDVSTDLVFGRRQAALAASREANAGTGGAAPSAWLRFEARGPGRSRLFLDGQLRMSTEPGFEGKAQASAEDARWLKDWLMPLAPQWTPQRLLFRAIDLSARASLAPTAIKLRDLVAKIDDAHVSGTLDYRAASGRQPARLDADLTTSALDLSGVQGFDPRGLVTRAFGAGDGSLRLAASALTLGPASRQGNGEPDSIGGLNLDLAKTGEKIELNELTFEGRDGAVIAVSGLLSQQKAHIDAKILGPHASGLAALLARLAPQPVADFMHARAGLLTPIDLSLSADAAEKDSAFGITALAAQGAIGGTNIEATVKEDSKQAGSVTFSARAQAKDSLPLLRLLGLASTPATTGPAQVEIEAHGPLGGSAQTAIKAALGPASLTFQGEVVTDLTQPAAKGAFRFSSPDAAPMLRTMGLVFPDFAGRVPTAASGDLSWTKTDFGLANLRADVAGTTLSGALDFGKPAPNKLTGSIAVDQLPAPALFELVLGPPEPVKAGSLWSSLAFAPSAFDLPNASIALTIKEMALPAPMFPRGASAKDARATLTTGPGLMDLQHLSLDMGGGRLAGEIKLRRAAGDVSIEGHLDFGDMALNGPAALGRMSGALDIAGTGKSPDSVIASLAGSGRALVSDLTIPRADPAALARVFTAFDQDARNLGADDVAAALANELKRADFRNESAAFDIAIAAGMLHLSPAAEPASANPVAILAASFDLRRAILNQRLSLALSPLPKDFSGPTPEITLLFEGSLSNPSVRIDAAALVNALAARAILRGSARIESYEFDIHERAFFYQRLLSERRRETERRKASASALQKAPNSAD
ncbi:MAG: AsmA family protein [Methylocella sp.]